MTTADVTLPEFTDIQTQLLWIIANNLEGNTIPLTLDDVTVCGCWDARTQLLWIIANNLEDRAIDMTPDDVTVYVGSPSEVIQLWVIANNLEGIIITLDLTDVIVKGCWPTSTTLTHIIAQVGATAPLDVADVDEDEFWTSNVQLLYIIAVQGLRAVVTDDLVLYHKYKTTEILSARAKDYSPLTTNRGDLYSGNIISTDGVNDSGRVTNSTSAYATFFIGVHTVSFHAYWNATGGIQTMIRVEGGWYFIQVDTSGEYLIIGHGGNWNKYAWPDTGTWHRYDFVWNGAILKFYLDGALQTVTSQAGAITFLDIGSNFIDFGAADGQYYFNGKFSKFVFTARAYTAAEILDLYKHPERNLTGSAISSEVKGLWPLAEGVGTTGHNAGNVDENMALTGPTWGSSEPDPVPQTALIDWNKATNLVASSEDASLYGPVNCTYTANTHTAPDSKVTADKFLETAVNDSHFFFMDYTVVSATDYNFSICVKAINGRNIKIYGTTGFSASIIVDLSDGSIIGGAGFVEDLGNGWYRIGWDVTTTSTTGRVIGYIYDAGSQSYLGDITKGVAVWGQLLTLGSGIKAYYPTTGTAQSSAILLPEGLTSGKDLLGVNSILRPRLRSLNLDGANYGSVPDDASLDMTDTMTIMCWVNLESLDGFTALLYKATSSQSGSFHLGLNPTKHISGGVKEVAGWRTIQSTSDPVDLDTWTHAAITIDLTAGILVIYKNGVAIKTDAAYFYAILGNNEPVLIGQQDGIEYLSGQLAFPLIYNSALTADEVLQNYNAHKSIFGL